MIYTPGYLGKSPEQLLSFLEEHDAVLYDIRYSPFSRDSRWTKSAMRLKFGARYLHVKDFGNVNYKNDGPVKLLNPDVGLFLLRSERKSIVLVCACRIADRCHRSTVAALLTKYGYQVSEIDAEQLHLFFRLDIQHIIR